MENLVIADYLKSKYQNKKVFITGHTGFKGSWLLACLHVLGAKTKGYALDPNSSEDLYNCIDGDALCDSVIADIRLKDKLSKEIVDFEPDFIFHLAAQPLVRLSYEIPLETFDVNVIGTGNLLDAVRLLKNECSVVIITTDKVYENKEWIYPYRENDNLGGYDPYSASKACAELLVNSYRNSFFNTNYYSTHKKGIASARAGNVIGGGDWAKDRIIPDIVKSLNRSENVFVRNPTSVRPWQHVLEPILGYLILGAKLNDEPLKFSSAYNFGPNPEDALSVEDLVKLAIKIWGTGDYYTPESINQPHEAKTLKLDINKATQELGWFPKLNSFEAIFWTMNWYKKSNQAEQKDFTFEQIVDYLKPQK